MLDCDTISQAKEKLLDAMYRVRSGEGGMQVGESGDSN